MNEAFNNLPEPLKVLTLAVISLGFAGALLWAMRASTQRRLRKLDDLAKALGMELIRAEQAGRRSGWLELRREGGAGRASVIFKGGSRSDAGEREDWTELETELTPSLGVGLALQSVNILTQLAGWVQGEDLKVGEARFDDAFAIRAQDPRAALALLENPELREAILAHQALALRTQVEDHRVVAVLQHEVLDAQRLQALLEAQARIASALGRGPSKERR